MAFSVEMSPRKSATESPLRKHPILCKITLGFETLHKMFCLFIFFMAFVVESDPKSRARIIVTKVPPINNDGLRGVGERVDLCTAEKNRREGWVGPFKAKGKVANGEVEDWLF